MLHPHVLRDMALFVEVAKRGSFSRAARALDMPISSLSRRIMLFEAAIGLRLIERTTRTLTLTRHGETYLPRAARLVDEAQRTVEEMLAQARGSSIPVRIAVPAEPWIQRTLAAAIAEVALPDRVTLHIEVATAGLDGEVFDLAVLTGEPGDTGADVRALPDLEVGLFASHAYLDRRGVPGDPHDLEPHETILVGRHKHAEWRLMRQDRRVVARVAGRIACTNPDLVRRLAVDGIGIMAAATVEVAEDVDCGVLVRVLPEWSLPARPLRIAITRRTLPADVRGWLERLVEKIGVAVR